MIFNKQQDSSITCNKY